LEQIDSRQLWNMLRKHWIILLALPVLPTLALGAMSFLTTTPPVYVATTTLIVERKAPEAPLAETQILDNTVLQQHIKNYSEIAKSRTVKETLINSLNLPLTVEKLDSAITVNQVNSTDLLKIQVTYKDPVLAAAIAKEAAQELTKAVVVDKVSIVDQAEVPDKPVAPSKSKKALSVFLVGLMASLSLIILLVYLDNTVKTPSDVKDVLGIPLLGMIARYDKGKRGKKALTSSLITLEQTNSPISESYRSIRTNLDFVSTASGSQKILITSSGLGEGKSVTVANLAVSLAQAGKSVLVLDADLRNPTQHKLFGLDNEQGLSGLLAQDQDFQPYIRKTEVPGVMVLTGGVIPPNPAELVGSDRMKRLILEVSAQYDRVILDTPAIVAVTDAAILAQQVEGVILVLASGDVNREDAQRAKELLDNVDAKILGAVLNKVM